MPLRYTTTPTPVGVALAVESDDGLVALRFAEGSPERLLDQIMAARREPAVRDDEALYPVVTQLEHYFAGELRSFDIPLDLAGLTPFTRAALEAIREIPYGETAGYGEVAITAGIPRAARAVGTACANTPISVVIPVHRVVRSDGSLGEYGGRPEVKRALLALESGIEGVLA
ncbi:Methylated-DNA--protein-cysteine methyltransferase [Microbacterium sp. C448]|uniref:methylated-DNA--[protein]-cysteine S-methyltransferase n=1 Tax=Microbacterium TaxID=33882 RepID=UPI0003DDFAD7|nr:MULTISPECIES: methylated-DNA--[protein]-cysteine S-methyltransferase [Microbacterium]CDK00411.1 Methylated-DNA--protein-cysteine methyltransferase [Microbacterium sp. C448]